MEPSPRPELNTRDQVFLRRGLVWFFLGLPFSIVTCALAVNPIQLLFYLLGQGKVTRASAPGAPVGLEILGFLVVALCLAYASVLAFEHYFTGWRNVRKYVFHAWIGSLVAAWLVILAA